jgi:hypothetical protein
MTEVYTWSELAEAVGKSVPFIRSILSQIGVDMPRRVDRLPESMVQFLRKVVALRMFSVPIDDIAELFRKERKILDLLHFDTLSNEAFWFLAHGDNPVRSDRHLLLTGQDLGFPLAAGAIQCNLDFRVRNPELFGGHEMGEDVRQVVDLYLRQLRKIDGRVKAERPVLVDALSWVGSGLLP